MNQTLCKQALPTSLFVTQLEVPVHIQMCKHSPLHGVNTAIGLKPYTHTLAKGMWEPAFTNVTTIDSRGKMESDQLK